MTKSTASKAVAHLSTKALMTQAAEQLAQKDKKLRAANKKVREQSAVIKQFLEQVDGGWRLQIQPAYDKVAARLGVVEAELADLVAPIGPEYGRDRGETVIEFAVKMRAGSLRLEKEKKRLEEMLLRASQGERGG